VPRQEKDMITRRELIASGIGATAAANAGETPLQDSALLSSMLTELREIRRAVSIEGTQAVAQIREAQRVFFKNSGRFPDFIDVGFTVFQSVVDWLIAVQQPVTISLVADGRYSLTFIGSTIVLRADFADNYVGQGYNR
jgi:hypothetical protein